MTVSPHPQKPGLARSVMGAPVKRGANAGEKNLAYKNLGQGTTANLEQLTN
jgi:hypothetical protein